MRKCAKKAFFLILVIVLMLNGCGSSGNAPSEDKPATESRPSSETGSATEEHSVKGTVTFVLDKKYETAFCSDSADALATPDTAVPGRRFRGWATEAGGKAVLSAEENIYYRTIADLLDGDGNLTLYPVYSDVAVVTFTANGKTTVMTLDSMDRNEAPAPGAKIDGSVFLGWSTNHNASVILRANEVFDYFTVQAYRDAEGNVAFYPVCKAPGTGGIKLYQYSAPAELPRIDINTENGIALDDKSLESDERKGLWGEVIAYNYAKATVSVGNIEEAYVLNEVAAQVKIRGNYTAEYDKKPIRIKFDKKQKMLGLNHGEKFKSWVLLAEWKDPSMLQNSVASYIGSALLEGNGYYVTDFCYVQVYLNGAYNGLYLLVEQQQINENRVNLPEAESAADGVHVGYLIEYDGYYFNEPALQQFTVRYNRIKHYGTDGDGTSFDPTTASRSTNGFTITNDIYSKEQHDFIQKCIQTIWDVVYDATYNPHTNLASQPYHTMDGNGNYVAAHNIATAYDAVASVIDIPSLVDMYILHEITEDFDVGWSSFNFALDMSEGGNHLLTYTAPWDFDYALGNSTHDGGGVAATTGQIANRQQLLNQGKLVQSGDGYAFAENAVLTSSDFTFSNAETLYAANTGNPWLVVCTNQGWFWQLVNKRWTEAAQAGVFSGALEMICVYTERYAGAYAENYARWNNIGKKIDSAQPAFVTYFRTQAHAAAYLKAWLEARVHGLTAAFAAQAARHSG